MDVFFPVLLNMKKLTINNCVSYFVLTTFYTFNKDDNIFMKLYKYSCKENHEGKNHEPIPKCFSAVVGGNT